MNTPIPSVLYYTLHDGNAVAVCVQRSWRAKKVSLRFVDGEFRLVVPEWLSVSQVMESYRCLSPWVLKKYVDYLSEKRNCIIPTSIVLPIEKKTYQVITRSRLADAFDEARLAEKAFWYENSQLKRTACLLSGESISLYADDLTFADVSCVLQKFGMWKAKEILPPFCREIAAWMHVRVRRITIRNQRTRLGSCTCEKQGGDCAISLNWRAILLSLEHVRQLCHHELCHSFYMNHSQEFYKALQSLNDNADKLERELARIWKTLPAWSRYQCRAK